jgi:hypothetical protein
LGRVKRKRRREVGDEKIRKETTAPGKAARVVVNKETTVEQTSDMC